MTAISKVRLPGLLMTQPLARDPRVNIPWQATDHVKVKYMAYLTGSSDITMYWLKNYSLLGGKKSQVRVEPRAPTAICVSTLFTLLAAAQKSNNPKLEFNSLSYLSKCVFKHSQKDFYTKAVHDALRLWQQMSLHYGGDINMELPPPVDSVHYNGNNSRIKINLNPRWLDSWDDKTRVIPLPLPMHATPQNIVLHTLYNGSTQNLEINPFFYVTSGNKKGLNDYPWCPLESFVVVEKWYKRHGGNFEYQRQPFGKHPAMNRWQPSRFIHTLVERPPLTAKRNSRGRAPQVQNQAEA